MFTKKRIGVILGVLVAVTISFIDIPSISIEGKLCLAFTFMTVIFWAFQVMQPGYTSALYLILLVLFKVAEPALVFSTWTGPMMFLIIGAYLIAGAVKDSGLGERIAYNFILRYVTSFKSIIISSFILTFILSILIPHPWPRAFLIMSVMSVVIKSANMPKKDAIIVGFSVFAASVPVSIIFLTGDASLSPLAVQQSGMELGWLGWFKMMVPPGIIASIIACIMILFLFKPSEEVHINKEEIKKELDDLGKLTTIEKRTAFWLIVAIVLWLTDSIHGLDIGWITMLIAVFMAMPIIGEVLTPKSWGGIPIHVLIFLTAAVAIGRVGGATGMNEWIADTVLPSSMPSNIFILAAIITAISMLIHMALGSVIAVMGIVIPAMVAFTTNAGVSPLVITLITYTAIATHYIFPFQHLNMLVGLGEENGGYTQKETIKFGIPFIFAVFFITVLIEIPYWKLLGLI